MGEVIAVPPESHFWLRKAPYRLTNLGNSLISQQMRPPSERTKPILRADFSGVFPFVTQNCYSFVQGGRLLLFALRSRSNILAMPLWPSRARFACAT